MNYPAPYRQIIRVLLGYGLSPSKLAVGGGYPRDIRHGGTPSDLDLVLVGGLPAKIDGLWFVHCIPDDWVITDWHTTEAWYEGATEDFNSRLDQVVQLRYVGTDRTGLENKSGHIDVDLLVATDKYTSVNQHITDNDFNLNHYRIDSLGILCGQDPYYVGGSPEGVLVPCRTAGVTPERHNRMVDLAKQYGWHANIQYRDSTE